MSEGSANIVVRERSPRESLDLAFPFLLRLGGFRYVALAATIELPLFALCWWLTRALSLGWPLTWLLAFSVNVWAQGLFTVAAGELMFENELVILRVLRKFLRRVVPYTVALLATRLSTLVSVVLLILPPLLWARFLFIPEVILLEGATLTESFSRATKLSQGSRRALPELLGWLLATLAFGVVAAEALGRGIFEYTLQLPIQSDVLFEDGRSYYAVFGLFVAFPVAATLRFLAYIDGRARRDAWEVQIKMQRIIKLDAEAR